jgi:phosphatidylglycerol:prolipoprotein diacylglycerol transferase
LRGGHNIIDPVAFEIGSIQIRWYGLIIGIAILLGLFLTIKESKRKGIDPDFFMDFFIFGIPAAILGARIYYIIFRWELYKNQPLRIFAFREGGLAIHGAIIGGLAVLLYLTKKRNVNFWKTVDILTPPLVLGQAIGRWGNFINQEAYGGIVSEEFINYFPEFIKNQMYLNGNYYHPAFLYESIWDFSVFLFLIYLRKYNPKSGTIFIGYIIAYSIGRFFIEDIRTDSLMLGPFKVAQLLSIFLIIIGVGLIYWKQRKE